MTALDEAIKEAKASDWYQAYLKDCREYSWRGKPKPPVVRLPVSVWEDNPEKPGYVRRVRGRTLSEICQDIDLIANQRGLCVEYTSYHPHKGETEFPKGEPYLVLEHGGNEGYSLWLCSRVRLIDFQGPPTDVRVIRCKLLMGTDDCFKLLRVLFDLLDE